MTYPVWIRRLAWLAVLLVPIWLASEIDARGRGGGGGRGRGGGGRPSYSSRSPASSGSIRGSGTRARPTTRPSTRPATSRPATSPATRPATKPGAGGSGVAQRPGQKPGQGGGAQRPSQRPDQGTDRPDREANRDENREDWQDFANQRQEDRQHQQAAMQHNREEWWEEEGGHYYDGNEASMWLAPGMVFAIGATLTASAVSSMSCTMSPVAVSGATYYRCGNQWYSRAFTNGEVTYVVINPPAGY